MRKIAVNKQAAMRSSWADDENIYMFYKELFFYLLAKAKLVQRIRFHSHRGAYKVRFAPIADIARFMRSYRRSLSTQIIQAFHRGNCGDNFSEPESPAGSIFNLHIKFKQRDFVLVIVARATENKPATNLGTFFFTA